MLYPFCGIFMLNFKLNEIGSFELNMVQVS